MIFLRPYLLPLLLPLLLLCWRYPFSSRWVTGFRVALYVVLTLAAAGLCWRMPSGKGVCIAVVDRSSSMSPDAMGGALDAVKELDDSRPGESLLGVVSYAAKTHLEKMPDDSPFGGLTAYVEKPDASNVGLAIESALMQIPLDSPGRIMLLSDGQWTGASPASSFAKAASRDIPVDYRFWSRNRSLDLSIASVKAPLSVYEGESYGVECQVKAPKACDAVVRIRKGNSSWTENKVSLRRGLNYFSWKDIGETAGTRLYTVQVQAEQQKDSCMDNNTARCLVTVEGKKRVLVLTESPSGNLVKLLRASGIEAAALSPSPQIIRPDILASCSCVVLENVSASKLGMSGMELLASMVRNGSLGLLMTGGKSSFANGGYYKSPLEDILPVSLVQRMEERKAKVAMMVALDRSGSMSMSAGSVTKMDLANNATVAVLDLLHPDDEFGVLAVDSESHVVVPLAPLSSQPDARSKILSIESMGGGIFTYTALHDATMELLKSKAQVRHLVLFADASDAEEPGLYKELLDKVTASGITVSVVGLGTDHDSDSAFLMDVAMRGHGTCYFTEHAEELPRLFAEDTFKVALKTFIEEASSATFLNDALRISSSLRGTVSFSGYNLCFPKPKTSVAMVSEDDNKAPVCAFWQIGLGRAAALTIEADGKYTGAFATDANAGSLLAGLVNYVNASGLETGDFLVTQRLGQGAVHLEIALDPERKAEPFSAVPTVNTIVWNEANKTETQKHKFEWTAPDRLELDIPMVGSATFLSSVKLSDSKSMALPPVALPYSPEYADNEAGVDMLAEMARSTGGIERLRPDEIWERIPRKRRFADFMPLFSVLTILLLLLEVAERRLGLISRLCSRVPKEKPAKMERDIPVPAASVPVRREKPVEDIPQPAPAPEQPTAKAADSPLSAAMKQVRKRM